MSGGGGLDSLSTNEMGMWGMDNVMCVVDVDVVV